MRYLGVDYGMKRIGIARSDERGAIAFPAGTIVNDGSALGAICALAEREKAGAIIVGDTRSHGGTENPITAAAERFIEALGRGSNLPVVPVFEAWSSAEAARYAPKGKEHDDAAAAAVILQRYLDMRGDRVE